MTDARGPLLRTMRRVHKDVQDAAAWAEEAQRLIAESIDGGGIFQCEVAARAHINNVIAALRQIALDTATVDQRQTSLNIGPARAAGPGR